jgi:hypothetical protein
MKNFIVLSLVAILFSSVEASRVSTSSPISTWNPPNKRFHKSRAATSQHDVQMASEYVEESIDTFGLDDISTVSEQDCSEIEERQRIAPASARAALIAVVSATVIGGTRHAIELIL